MAQRDITVLIVDDAPEALANLSALLRVLGYKRIEVANNAKIALRTICRQDIDVVLCDLKMPGIDGQHLLQHLRAETRFEDLSFIMVSAYASKKHVVAALRAGADAYALKPITPAVIDEKIQKAIGRGSDAAA